MKYLRCTTPTLLDIREIITLGMTTKANSTTSIGHKGSGLKFALAYLHRLGGYIEARTASYHLKSEANKAVIRNIEHELIVLRDSTTGQTIDANITCHAGADTWIEPWFILREMLQNVIDEGGIYTVVEDAELPEPLQGTSLQIPLVEKLAAAWEAKDSWFQPRYPLCVSHGHADIKGLYYHGFLIHRGKGWKFSYDVTPFLQRSQLSEDRQLRDGDLYSVFYNLAEHVKFNDFGDEIYDAAYEAELTPDIEHLFDGVHHYIQHSRLSWGGPGGFSVDRFVAAFRRKNGENATFHTQELTPEDPAIYYATTAGFVPAQVPYRIANILAGYTDVTPLRQCLPTLQDRLKKVRTTDLTKKAKLKLAMRLVKKIQPTGTKVEIVEKILATDNMQCGALADRENNRVMVLESFLDHDVDEIAKMLIEEYAHLESGGGDNSQEMQHYLIDTIYKILVKNRRVSVEEPLLTTA